MALARMAAVVSPMENGSLPRAVAVVPAMRVEIPPPPRSGQQLQQQQQPMLRAVVGRQRQQQQEQQEQEQQQQSQPRVFPSFSPFITLPPVPTGRRSSGNHNSFSARGSGAIGHVWASIMSLGAAVTLPASISPLSFATGRGGSAGASAAGVPLSPASPRRSRRNRRVGRITRRNAFSSSPLSPPSLSPSSSSSLSTAVSLTGVNILSSGDGVVARVGGGGGDGEGVAVREAEVVGGEGGAVRAAVVESASSAMSGVEEGVAAMETAAVAPVSGPEGRPEVTKKVFLGGGSLVYTCSACRAHLATRDHVVSECFHGQGGRAFLFERCVNVTAGRPEDRLLMTGMHVVADISCTCCGADLGWKYEKAVDKSQKYKEGKFILEKGAITVEGRDGDGYHGSDRYGCGSSSSIIGWGADKAPFADCSRW